MKGLGIVSGALLAALMGAGAIYYWNSSGKAVRGTESAQEAPSRFKAAPRFELADSAGKTHRLEDLKGNVVLLHFWASWCPPCMGELPELVTLANQLKGRPIRLVLVSLDNEWKDALKALPNDSLPQDSTWSLLDTTLKVPESFGSYQFPETYLLNSRLEVVTKWVGPQDWKSPELMKLLDQLAAKAGS